MTSYRQILYQIVFSTKNRTPCLIEENREELFKYIWGIIQNKKCKLFRINGVEDHIHILSDLHPELSLANYVKEIKVSSSLWIKKKRIFPDFTGWAEGYGSFTYSYKDHEQVISYIKNQVEHHKKKSFLEEYRELLHEFGVVFDSKNP
jgi:REP element-mobilizing transposase RayT